jgi:hypothetical protein
VKLFYPLNNEESSIQSKQLCPIRSFIIGGNLAGPPKKFTLVKAGEDPAIRRTLRDGVVAAISGDDEGVCGSCVPNGL